MECDLPTLYAARGGDLTESDLYTVDHLTGACTSVGPIGYAVDGMEFDPTTGRFWAVTTHLSGQSPCCLISIDPGTGAGTLVGPLGLSSGPLYDVDPTAVEDIGVGDLCMLPDGRLIGLTNSGARGLNVGSLSADGNDRIVVIDKETGAASLFGSGADFDPDYYFFTDPASIVYDEVLGFIYVMSSSDEIIRVDPVTGQTLYNYTHINTDANNKCASIGPDDKCWIVEYGDSYPSFVTDFSGDPWLGYFATLDDDLAPDPLVGNNPSDPGGFNPTNSNDGADTIIIGTMDVAQIDAIAWGPATARPMVCDTVGAAPMTCD